MNFPTHGQCEALSRSLRGKLCEELTGGATRVIPAGQFIYYAGDPAHSIYFLRSGLAKTSVFSQSGEVVSTLLNRLREIGLLRYSRKGRIKFNLEALQQYLQSLSDERQ